MKNEEPSKTAVWFDKNRPQSKGILGETHIAPLKILHCLSSIFLPPTATSLPTHILQRYFLTSDNKATTRQAKVRKFLWVAFLSLTVFACFLQYHFITAHSQVALRGLLLARVSAEGGSAGRSPRILHKNVASRESRRQK